MPEHLPLPTTGPAPTLLPADGPEAVVAALLADGVSPADAAAEHPASSLTWALLAEAAERRDDAGAGTPSTSATIEAYAYARTGYHRGLDALRRAGWRGIGPVPWAHEPNRGFLRSLAALGRAAAVIGEDAEAQRISQFLLDCDAEHVESIRSAHRRPVAGEQPGAAPGAP